MKTSIKAQIAKAFTITLLVTASIPLNTIATEKEPIYSSHVTPYRKISVEGNVEVIIVQRKSEDITYADDNTGQVKVIKNSGRIRIIGNSKKSSKLFIYVNDIYRIEASDNVVIKTEGRLTTKFLQIILKGNARADINTNTQGLYTSLQDNSNLKLSGSTDDHTLEMDNTQKLNTDNFVAFKVH